MTILIAPSRLEADPESALASPSDALLTSQWYLRNIGQTGGTPGIDIDVVPVWLDYTGAGISVAVIDDGFDLTHQELAQAFDRSRQYDFRNDDNDGRHRLEQSLRLPLIPPAVVLNQFGLLKRCKLRSGNAHSADGWEEVLGPVTAL